MAMFHRIQPSHHIPARSYSTYNPYKQNLAADFHNCCGYCDDHHSFYGGTTGFHIDHFAPKSRFPALETTYTNLIYSCPYCNRSKSNKWVGQTSSQNVVDGSGFISPCDSTYENHLERASDGSISFKTSEGEYMYIELNLNLERHRIFYTMDILQEKLELLSNQISRKNEQNLDTYAETNIYMETSQTFCKYYKFFKSL